MITTTQETVLPRTIVNPTHGYAVTFLISAVETNNEYTVVEVLLPPGEGTPMHYHLDFTETFSAVQGQLGLALGENEVFLCPGDRPVQVPVKARHRFFNAGDQPIRFRCTIRPARRFEKTLRIIYGLGNDGLLKPSGMPKSILHLALIYETAESYLPGLPLWLQRGIFGSIARLAKLLGKNKELEKYYTGQLEPVSAS